MTQPQGVDANDVIDELAAHVGRLAKENAILRAQLTPKHTVTQSGESGTEQQ